MSQAFVRESDDQWLSDVGPSINALVVFLTRDNNGVRVYELSNAIDRHGRIAYKMSNGVSYFKDDSSHWQIAE